MVCDVWSCGVLSAVYNVWCTAYGVRSCLKLLYYHFVYFIGRLNSIQGGTDVYEFMTEDRQYIKEGAVYTERGHIAN